MNELSKIEIMPYSLIVGQEQLKLALELAYIAPRLGGVLISGERGTGKSTAVRAFSLMVYRDLPVTLPINATEDRVVGGLDVDKLMQSDPKWKDGLLVEAKGKLLYVDEVNLLDDHIVNIILDVTSTGKLEVQRDGQSIRDDVLFTLVGTMNPEEGGLRPQLLDRFGLMVDVSTATTKEERLVILENVLKFEDECVRPQRTGKSEFLKQAEASNGRKFNELEQAKKRFRDVNLEKVLKQCVALADAFQVEGNRGERVLAMAARAYAALHNRAEVTNQDLKVIAPLAFQHRRSRMEQSQETTWDEKDEATLKRVLGSE
ncbi:MAG: AAA family ATPase [Nostoc sp.]|uniref:AAA family ATPase n=1 Tax=Nostoc sp. TaxID=1180 RepID=UPI002FFC4637